MCERLEKPFASRRPACFLIPPSISRSFPPAVLAGARAAGQDHRAAGGGVPEEEPHRPAGPPDPHPQREHQHPDQGAGAQGQGGAEDPQRSQSADQVVTSAPPPPRATNPQTVQRVSFAAVNTYAP